MNVPWASGTVVSSVIIPLDASSVAVGLDTS